MSHRNGYTREEQPSPFHTCGAYRVLESRIAALAAELATERAARELAEAGLLSEQEGKAVLIQDLQQAERDRDTALARVKAWEQAYDSDGFGPQCPAEVQVFLRERDRANGHVAALEISKLKRERDTLSEAFDRAHARELELERERDAALAREERTSRALTRELDRRLAAESALASARATIGRVAEYVGYLEQDIAAARKNREPQTGMHVPYHGAFCSAPISTIKDLERFARSMRDLLTSRPAPAPERSDKRSRWNELGELAVTVMATSKYPSPAPCSGCAAARELLLNLNECVNREDVRGVIRAWLTSHPAPVAAPSAYAIQEGWSDPEPEDTRAPVADPSNAGCDHCCGNQGDHERGCPATPVAAPCAGCARLSAAIDQAIRDMLSCGHPFEAGVAKAINDLRAAQKEHP